MAAATSMTYKPVTPTSKVAFFRAQIHRMVDEFVKEGEYKDHTGKWHTNPLGILNAWEEIDKIEDGKA